MPSKVYNNVEDHRLLDGGKVVEDVTKVTLPKVSHPTSTISAAGMAMDVDMPNITHVDAMEFEVAHNNGVNCKLLPIPGKHNLEFRVVRQKYTVAKGEIDHESVKVRIVGIHKQTDKGSIEANNPYGSTETYSVLRYEEEIDGNVVTIIDAMSGVIKYNGKEYTSEVQNMLK